MENELKIEQKIVVEKRDGSKYLNAYVIYEQGTLRNSFSFTLETASFFQNADEFFLDFFSKNSIEDIDSQILKAVEADIKLQIKKNTQKQTIDDALNQLNRTRIIKK